MFVTGALHPRTCIHGYYLTRTLQTKRLIMPFKFIANDHNNVVDSGVVTAYIHKDIAKVHRIGKICPLNTL